VGTLLCVYPCACLSVCLSVRRMVCVPVWLFFGKIHLFGYADFRPPMCANLHIHLSNALT
jgi:hypothetical protein